MKNLLCFLVLGILFCCIPFIYGSAKLQAQTMPKIYYEQSYLDNNSNNVISEVFTNDENSKKELESNGYILNKEDSVYTKTINLEEYNAKNSRNGSANNLSNTFNDIFNLQTQMFAKMNEIFSNFGFLNSSNKEQINTNFENGEILEKNKEQSINSEEILENKNENAEEYKEKDVTKKSDDNLLKENNFEVNNLEDASVPQITNE